MDPTNPPPSLSRPRVLRNRSQTYTITKSSNPDLNVDSDASKRSSLHRHAHSHHHIPHPSRRLAKDILGLQNGSSVLPELSLSKQTSRVAAVSPGSEASGSRRESLQLPSLDGSGQGRVAGVSGSGVVGMNDAEVESVMLREQWRSKIRENELRNTLQNLSEQSMKTTRQLDDIYYRLLEKVSGLQSTINNLQELSALTGQLHIQFRDGADELKSDVQRQIDGFGGFSAQKGKIETLEVRVKESKKKADGLSERLNAAKERVLRLEEREKEWQDSVNWRLRWMWIVLGSIVGIILAAYLLQMYGPDTGPNAESPSDKKHEARQRNAMNITDISPPAKTLLEEVLEIQNDTAGGKANATSSQDTSTSTWSIGTGSEEPTSRTTCSTDEASFLRIFDEL